MSAFISQVPSQMSQIIALKDKFIEISKQSDEKLTWMIDTANNFRSGMEPLKTEVDQLQIRVKNIEFCINGLSHVQNFYKTGSEVEQTIIKGPSSSLSQYIVAMDRIMDSLSYFNENNTEHQEYTRLTTLLMSGLKALNSYFGEILNQSFTAMPTEILYKLAEKEEVISSDHSTSGDQSALLGCDTISEEVVHSLQEISNWLRKAASPLVASSKSAAVSARSRTQRLHQHMSRPFHMTSSSGGSNLTAANVFSLPESLSQYCEFRRDWMHVMLIKLREYQKTLEKNAYSARPSEKCNEMILSGASRRRGLKAVGIVWDANSRRGVVADTREVDDLDSEHYATCLSAFLILIQHERQLLNSLNLAANSHESYFAYDVICSSALNDILSEGENYVLLMNRVISRGEFYMIVSLLTIMRRFIELSPTFVETLKLIDALAQPFTDLVSRFRLQIKATFDAFLQHLGPGMGVSQVPPDATVHELASTVLLFLEKLMDYEIIVATALTWDEMMVQPDLTFSYLTTVTSKPQMARSAFGQYIFRVITSLVGNIDKKAEAYTDDLSRIIFQLNNLRYILTTLESTGLQNVLNEYDSAAVSKLMQILNESKQVYTRTVLTMIGFTNSGRDGNASSFKRKLDGALPVNRIRPRDSSRKDTSRVEASAGSGSPRATVAYDKLDSKDRSQMKDLWSNVNQGFASLLKHHAQLSIPDKDMREDLRACLSRELVPLYQELHSRSLQSHFTSRREKYIKMTVREFQAKLDQIFTSGSGQTPHQRS